VLKNTLSRREYPFTEYHDHLSLSLPTKIPQRHIEYQLIGLQSIKEQLSLIIEIKYKCVEPYESNACYLVEVSILSFKGV